MTILSKLSSQAITAAKNSDWEEAIAINSQILEQDPQNINAFNRMGIAYLQLNKKNKARDCFKKTLEIDKTNNIAKKQLARIKAKHHLIMPTFHREHFIEEPGRTKIVELHRLAGKGVLSQLAVGQTCQLNLKKRYISVENEQGVYIGALPEDISFRLSKLIKTGNKYSCRLHSCNYNQCSVYLKEINRSKRNAEIHSFPPNKTAGSTNDIDDRFLLEDDDIPVQIVDHDNDNEKTLDDIDTTELGN